MKRRGKRKSYPKTHKFAIGDEVVFVFAGSKRIGNIIEKTWEEVGVNPKGHATFVISSGGKIYPCVGVDGSKEFGNIITIDTRAGTILRNNPYEITQNNSANERGYKHLALPKLKEMCRKYKLKVGGKKKDLVERLEMWYKEAQIDGVASPKDNSKKVVTSKFFK